MAFTRHLTKNYHLVMSALFTSESDDSVNEKMDRTEYETAFDNDDEEEELKVVPESGECNKR